MPRRRPARVRWASGWALYIAVIAALRVAGLGAAPPEASEASASASGESADGTAVTDATMSVRWILGSVDIQDPVDATNRCLGAGPRCTSDDALAADTTRDRLASFAASLAAATDPDDPAYRGDLDNATADRVRAVRPAADRAARALADVLAAGCAGSIDGVPVDHPPADCDRLIPLAQQALTSFTAAMAEPSGSER